jgi:3-mercaptopyruvate sulfurtransferase SseA/uncharacterized membrane protein YdjX (TVP38/TMEM64 family)
MEVQMKKLLVSVMFLLMFVMGAAAESSTATKNYEQYSNSKLLISPEKAGEMLAADKNIVVLDIRKEEDYNKGHIPGSHQIWRPSFSADKGEYEYGGMRASRVKMAEMLGSYGITADTHVILVSAKAEYDAARLWWIMDMYGHENITLIDGGIDGWKNAGLPMPTEASPKPEAVKYEFPKAENTSKFASIEDVKKAIGNKDVVIIDTRTDFEHDGLAQYEGAFAKGRIPSQYYVPWDKMVNKDKSFKSKEEMEAILAENGITKDKQIISYCQSGVRSAHMTFVLSQLLGWDNVKNYDGSWIEWSYNVVNGNVELEKTSLFKVFFSYVKSREKMEMVIGSLGAWAPAAYITMYALITITCVSVLPITLVGGLVFGGVKGVLYTAIGASLGLSLAFLIARYIARKPIESKFGQSDVFKKINEGVKNDGWFILATTRLIPVFPFGIQNYVYGLTSINFIQYSLLSTLFILPGTTVFVLLAGAVASGDKATAIKMSLTASLIFFALTVVTKIISKKSKTSVKSA